MTNTARRAPAIAFVRWLCLAAALATATPAVADGRTRAIARVLRTSSSFRARAHAALTLGRAGDDSTAVRALLAALKDKHPAVRTAAAVSLGQTGAPQAERALQRTAARDRDRTVRRASKTALKRLALAARKRKRQTAPAPTRTPSASDRYYVGVGVPGAKASGVSSATAAKAHQMIREQLGQIDGVVLAPDGQSSRKVKGVLRKHRLVGYFVDSSVVKVERTSVGTRAVVSVILGTYPGRDMRALLQGKATVPGSASGPGVTLRAIEGAITGALRRLPQAMAAAEARASRN